MAGVIGSSSGGYASVGPTRNYIGEAMSNVQDGMFRQNAQRIADERNKTEAERTATEDRRRDFADAQEFAKQNPFIATGTGLDASNRQSYMNAKTIAAEARDNFMKTGDQKYNAIYENAVASVNGLSEMPNKLNALKEDWVKNVANYNSQSLLKKGELLDKLGNGEIVQTNDANGNPRYSIFDRDENGNLAKISHKEISGQQLLSLLEPVKSFNVTGEKGLIDQFQKSLPDKTKKVEIVKTKNGEVERTTEGREGYENLAAVKSKELTINRSAVYAALQSLGLDPENEKNYTNPDVLKEVETSYYDLLVKNTKPSVSEVPYLEREKFDHAKSQDAQAQRNSNRTYNQQERKTGEEKKDITYTEKEDYMGKSTAVVRKLSESELASKLAENAKEDVKTQEETWSNPITKGISNAFKAKATDTSKMTQNERLAYYRNLNKKK
jgi:hypothetical protein